VLQVTEESQMRSVEEALHRRFDATASPAKVHAEVAACLDSFRDARIRNFVPVLVQREAAGRLRGPSPALS
jgi:hypothetical protein